MKTYETIDPRTGKPVTLKRVETECKCLGCFFLDEENGECLCPMPNELGDDCVERNESDLRTQHYQFKEI